MTSPLSVIAEDGSVTLTRADDVAARRFINAAKSTLQRAYETARHPHDRSVIRDRINGLNSVLAMLGRD